MIKIFEESRHYLRETSVRRGVRWVYQRLIDAGKPPSVAAVVCRLRTLRQNAYPKRASLRRRSSWSKDEAQNRAAGVECGQRASHGHLVAPDALPY
eukprot:SAG11_NODE_2721_length_3044_cov_10.912733_6_plen_96_part_00